MIRVPRVLRIAVGVLLLSGCDDPTGPAPPGAVRLDPIPSVYPTWWIELQKEAGISGSMERIRWYVVPGGPFPPIGKGHGSNLARGRWISDGRIYLAEGWTLDERNVKHEMLHELLRGDAEHRHSLFRIY